MRRTKRKQVSAATMAMIGAWIEAFLLIGLAAHAQTPNAQTGINSANTAVRTYFDILCTLMYAIGAIIGLIGAIRVYGKWSHGDPDTGKIAAAWFGACIFLVLVSAVISAFFGVS
jgi:hypothetical protein